MSADDADSDPDPEVLRPTAPLLDQTCAAVEPRRPVRGSSLVVQLSTELRQLIVSGRWPVGMRIPGEHDLAHTLGVSRATVREALRGLSLLGLLEPRIGDGTYVRATDEIAGVLLRNETPDTLDHVLDARAGLEATGARLAARDASPEDLDALDDALATRAVAHDSGDLNAYVAADGAFHRAVVAASGNPVLIRLHTALAEVTIASIARTATLPEPPGIGQVHARLVAAIRARDQQAAERIAHDLIRIVRPSSADDTE